MDKLKNKIQEHMHGMDVENPSPAAWEEVKRHLAQSAKEDELKKHILENKSQLEIEAPDAEAWEGISRSFATNQQAPVRSIRKIIIYSSVAACLLILIGVTVFRNYTPEKNNTPDNGEQTIAAQPKPDTIIGIDTATKQLAVQPNGNEEKDLPDAKDTQHMAVDVKLKPSAKAIKLPPRVLQLEKDYDEIIEGQLKYTRSLAIYGESSAYFEQFKNDFNILEEQEKALRKDIAKNGLQETSIDDLASIYQQKLTVLKKLQNEINKTSSRNKNRTDTIPVYINL